MSQFGLSLFVVFVAASFGLLLWDLTLYVRGKTTITRWTVQSPTRIALVMSGPILGIIGLLVHFLVP